MRFQAWAQGQNRLHLPAPERGRPEAEEQEASASPAPDSWRAFCQGSDATTWVPGPGPGGGPADVGHPKRFRRAFPDKFSRAFCLYWDIFGQNARENWPALGGPVDCRVPLG